MPLDGFGFHVATTPTLRPAELIELARAADRLGYDRFWVPDQGFGPDPFVLLAEVARVTTIPLGLGITSPLARHPVQVARSIATLAQLYPDRDWIFGLGMANRQHVLRPLGLDVRRAPAHLAAAVRLIRSLLEGGPQRLQDDDLSFTCDGIELELEAPTRVRIYVGSRGPLVLRTAAGATADGALVESLFTPEGIAWARERLDDGSEAAGRGRFDRPHVAWQLVQVLGDGEQPSSAIRRFGAMFMGTSAPEMLERIGVAPAIVERVRSGRVPLDADDLPLDEITRFVAAQAPDRLQATIRAARDAGATAWSSVLVGEQTRMREQLERFATDVMAPLRAPA